VGSTSKLSLDGGRSALLVRTQRNLPVEEAVLSFLELTLHPKDPFRQDGWTLEIGGRNSEHVIAGHCGFEDAVDD